MKNQARCTWNASYHPWFWDICSFRRTRGKLANQWGSACRDTTLQSSQKKATAIASSHHCGLCILHWFRAQGGQEDALHVGYTAGTLLTWSWNCIVPVKKWVPPNSINRSIEFSMHFGHFNMFHFPGVGTPADKTAVSLSISTCFSWRGGAKAPTHLAGFSGADPTRKKGRWGNAGDGLKQSTNQMNSLSNQATDRPTQSRTQVTPNPNPNPTKNTKTVTNFI